MFVLIEMRRRPHSGPPSLLLFCCLQFIIVDCARFPRCTDVHTPVIARSSHSSGQGRPSTSDSASSRETAELRGAGHICGGSAPTGCAGRRSCAWARTPASCAASGTGAGGATPCTPGSTTPPPLLAAICRPSRSAAWVRPTPGLSSRCAQGRPLPHNPRLSAGFVSVCGAEGTGPLLAVKAGRCSK
jgi:hypothetical protein